MKCSILVNLIGLSFFLIKQAYPGKLTHSCSLVLCLVIVLWAEFDRICFKWKKLADWKKKTNVAKSPIKDPARGETGPKTSISEKWYNDAGLQMTFEETLNEGDQRAGLQDGYSMWLPNLDQEGRYNR